VAGGDRDRPSGAVERRERNDVWRDRGAGRDQAVRAGAGFEHGAGRAGGAVEDEGAVVGGQAGQRERPKRADAGDADGGNVGRGEHKVDLAVRPDLRLGAPYHISKQRLAECGVGTAAALVGWCGDA
jgi:hypothetical protein